MMKRNKITAVILSIVMSMSMLMPSFKVMADETSDPSETQKTESIENKEPKTTEKQVQKTTEKQEAKETEKPVSKETEKKDPEGTEKPKEKETEKTVPEQTESKETESASAKEQEIEPEESEKDEPLETENKESTESEEQKPSESEGQQPSETEETVPKETEPEISAKKPGESTKSKAANGQIATGTCGDNLTWTLDEDGTLTISGSGNMDNWKIVDSEIDSSPWVSYKQQISTVKISESVNNLGSYAVYNCTNLKSITLPNNLTIIGNHSFEGCTSLTSVDLPKGLERIGAYAFHGCSSLTSIVIPDTVVYIFESAFEDCTKLERITLNEPSHELDIRKAVFMGCTSLSSITIPHNVSCSYSYLFYGCTNLKSITILNDRMSGVGDYEFSYCENLENIELPDSVNSIGVGAFYNCTKLKSFRIPNNVTTIKTSAFNRCTSLSSISFSNNPITYGETVFYYCSSLSSVDGIRISGKKIPENFFKYSGLKHFSIPDNITNIGEEAFEYCENLNSIEISSSVTTIGSHVFCYSGLLSIYIPKNVERISSNTFDNCERLSSIVFEEKGGLYNTGNSTNDLGRFLDGCTRLANVAFAKDELNEKNLCSEATKVIHYFFNVYYSDDGHGTVTGKKRSCASDTIEIVVTPDEGYELDKLMLTYPLPAVEILSNANGKYTVTLPLTANGADIEATFKKTEYYSIKVNSGGATPATATSGTTISITANAAPSGKVFDKWIVVSGTFSFANPSSSTTTFKMPAENVEITATYKTVPSGSYAVTVNNGTATPSTPTPGAIVTIKANDAPSGKVFDRWEVNVGAVILLDATSSTTLFVMPAENVEITATYKKAENSLSIKGKTATVKYKKLKKKNQTLSVSQVIAFTNKGQGTLTYAKVSGNSKILINKTTGKVTIKKKLKKKTYTVKVKVMASGDESHNTSGWKTVTFKIKVK